MNPLTPMLFFVQSLPLDFLRRLARGMGRLVWRLDRRHRRIALRNVRLALGRGNSPLVSDGECEQIARESFARVAENAFLTAWMASRDDGALAGWMEVTGAKENLLPSVSRGRGVILAMSHFGNWEAAARIASRFPGVRFSTVYQPLKTSWFDRMIREWRARGGVRLINRHHGFAEATACLRRGEVVAMLVDQHAGDHGLWLPFFGRLASTTTLPAVLARRTGALILPLFCHPTPAVPAGGDGQGATSSAREKENISTPSAPDTDHRSLSTDLPRSPLCRIEFGETVRTEGRSDGEIMSELHQRLEAAIRRDPANWFWLHDRWKTPSPNFLLKKYRRGVQVPTDAKLKPFRILVRCPNWLGDAILAIPALRAIREGRPDCHLTLLTPPRLADLWKGQSYVDQVATSLNEARRDSYDAAILLPNSLRSALEAWFLRIPRRQGYAGHWRRWLLTAVCPDALRAGPHEHDVKNFCALARWCGAEVASEIPIWELPPAESVLPSCCPPSGISDLPASRIPHPAHHGESVLRRTSSNEISDDYIVLHPGAAYGSAKRWLPEQFVELVKRLPVARWRLVGNADERKRNARLAAEMGDHVEDWTGRLTLPQLASTLACARAVVCNDSGPMHLAAAVGAPVVAVFGSTEPLRTGPLGANHRVLRHTVECSPCFRRECPGDLRCMKAVTVDEVEAALWETLTENAKGHA